MSKTFPRPLPHCLLNSSSTPLLRAQALEEGEFTCPVCRRIANMVIPMQPALLSLPPSPERSSLESPSPSPFLLPSLSPQGTSFLVEGIADPLDLGALGWLHSADWGTADGAVVGNMGAFHEPMDAEIFERDAALRGRAGSLGLGAGG